MIGAGLFLCQCNEQKSVATRIVPPNSLNAYMLKAEDRRLLAEWTRLHRDGPPDSRREWVRQHYGPFQSIGLRLMEQATLFHGDGKAPLAAAKFDTARDLGEALVEAVNDSFLLRQIDRITELDEKELSMRAQAALLFAQAEDSLYAGKYEEAVQRYEKTIHLARQASDEKLAIDASYRLLYFLDRRGKDQEVIDDGKKIIAEAERAGYQWRSSLTFCLIARAYINLNQYALALDFLAKATNIAERLHDRGVLVRSYQNQARIYYHREEYQQAEIVLQRVLDNDSEKKWSGLAHLMQGLIHAVRGEYDRARTKYELALKFFRQYDVDRVNEALALNRLAVLNTLIGDYENALKLERAALSLKEAIKNPDEAAESLSNLGFIYAKMDSFDKAIAMCQEALALFQEKAKLNAANTWLILGTAQLKKGNLFAAFDNTAKIAGEINNQLIKIEATLGYGQGALILQKDQPDLAKSSFTSALAMARKIGEPSLIAQALLGLSEVEKRLHHFDLATELIDQAITQVEHLRTGISQDSLQVSYFATTQELFDQAILLALARKKEKLALQYAERARARGLREALGKIAFKDLPKSRIEMGSGYIPNVQALQSSIPNDVQIVEYRLTPDTLVIWLIDRQKVIARQAAISSKDLGQIVDGFLRSLGADGIDAFRARVASDLKTVYAENRQMGRRLSQLVWEPIADIVAPGKRLFIIPDGVLHRLPFGALVIDERFFEEKYIWAKAPSLAILAENAHEKISMSRLARTKFLMIADDLPSVGSQKKLLSKLFANPAFLIEQEATYENLQERLRESANIVYFSVHAVADEHHPMNSYIELYRHEETNGHIRKAKVYARELLQLNYSETGLVVLNACETASGKIAAGEGALNLVRVFALGKVPVVIASLWQNDDRLSARITGDFFKSIVDSPDYAMALHQAKIHAMEKLRKEYRFALPYFWAVFEVYQNRWDTYLTTSQIKPTGGHHATSWR